MKAIAICLISLLITNTALPCANFSGSGTKYNGKSSAISAKRSVGQLKAALLTSLMTDGEKLEAELRGSTNFNDRSDYSVALMYLGRSKEAVQLLTQLEKEKPGEYFIAANLGTAYELSGNNEEALRWINEGIRRNPNSHDGTEWLHAKILEAKIANQKDPDYFRKHSVLDLQPGGIKPEITIDGRKFTSQQVADALLYQLKERLQFVKPPDAAVAGLLFDYAAIEAVARTMESATGMLRLASEYGYPEEKIRPLVNDFDRRISLAKWRRYATYGGIGVLVVAALYYLRKQVLLRTSRSFRLEY